MIRTADKQFQDLSSAYKKAFGEKIPLMAIPESETIEGLTDKVNQSIKAGKDLLPGFYKWGDNDIIY